MTQRQTQGRSKPAGATGVIGIVCALNAEARPLGPARRWGSRLTSLADGTLLAISGMGSAAAAVAAHDLVEAHAASLVSWGMAGGLDPKLRPGAIVLPAQIADSQGRLIETARSWRERLGTALASHGVVCGGKLLTMNTVLASPADKADGFRRTQALAVDMESFAVAQVAAAYSLPFIAVRVIVDGADDVLPRFLLDAIDGRKRISGWRLARSLLQTPGEIASVLRLRRRYHAASRSLQAIARSESLLGNFDPRGNGSRT